MAADSIDDLVDRWVQGWGDSRGMQRERIGRGWVVEVASETRAREYVIASPTLEEIRDLIVPTSARTDVWLTVVGERSAATVAALAALEPVAVDELMMMISPLSDSSAVSAIEPSDISIEERGLVAHARIRVDGHTAASGQAAIRGSDVVFDRIETLPGFRRRGMARQIMAGLTSWAGARQAQAGLLMASVEGRHLYRSLGWTDVTPLASFRGHP